MEIGKIISRLRKGKGLNQRDFAKLLGVSNGAVGMWETGKRQPDLDTIKKIASFFDVTVDYLLGNRAYVFYDDQKKYFHFFFDCWDECSARIKYRLQELGIPESDFCKELSIDLDKVISINDLKSIANMLNVSTDYLLGLSDYKNVSSTETFFAQSFSTQEKEIIENFRLLNKDNKDIIVGELKKCLKEQRYESVAANSMPLRKTGTDNLGK